MQQQIRDNLDKTVKTSAARDPYSYGRLGTAPIIGLIYIRKRSLAKRNAGRCVHQVTKILEFDHRTLHIAHYRHIIHNLYTLHYAALSLHMLPLLTSVPFGVRARYYKSFQNINCKKKKYSWKLTGSGGH